MYVYVWVCVCERERERERERESKRTVAAIKSSGHIRPVLRTQGGKSCVIQQWEEHTHTHTHTHTYIYKSSQRP